MNTQEKIEAAGKKKEEGNTLFKAGKYARASKRYERVRTQTCSSCYVCLKENHVWVVEFNIKFCMTGCQVHRV